MIKEQKDFFFARGVLFVEGDTEVGAMPNLAKKIGFVQSPLVQGSKKC